MEVHFNRLVVNYNVGNFLHVLAERSCRVRHIYNVFSYPCWFIYFVIRFSIYRKIRLYLVVQFFDNRIYYNANRIYNAKIKIIVMFELTTLKMAVINKILILIIFGSFWYYSKQKINLKI